MELYEVVTKLNGPVDGDNIENLRTLCDLVDGLISDIDWVSVSPEAAPVSVGYAQQFLASIGVSNE